MLVAFEAGGGKSSVVHTILMILLQNEGYHTISLSPKALYSIDRDRQNHYFISLHQRLAPLELSLQSTDQQMGAIEAILSRHMIDRTHIKSMPDSYLWRSS